MSEATTGVPAAKASVRTMPKLSPPSEGAHSTSASCRWCHSSLVGDAAVHVDVVHAALDLGEQRLDRPRPERRRRRGGPGCGWRRPAKADSSTGRPLRSSSRPTNTIRSVGRLALRAGRRHVEVDPVGHHLVVAAEVALAGPAGGVRDGDPRAQLVEDPPRSERRSRSRSGATSPSRRGRCRRRARRRSRPRPSRPSGAIGSCTCTTSKRPARSSLRRRTTDSALDARFDMAPFIGSATVRPSGIT